MWEYAYQIAMSVNLYVRHYTNGKSRNKNWVNGSLLS